MKRKKESLNRGETLVEAIVSFSILIMMLTVLTSVVRLSARLNSRAAERSLAIETACNAIETGAFTGTRESRLLLSFGQDDVIEIPIRIHETDWIESFDTDWED